MITSNDKNPASVTHAANLGAHHMESWCNLNHLLANPSKSVLLNFHPYQKQIDQSPLVTFVGQSIKRKEHTKFLGLTISETLDWSPHIDTLASKLSSSCYLIYSIRNVIQPHLLNLIYYSHFQSPLQYGLLFWGPSCHTARIFLLPKRAVRFMAHAHWRAHCRDIFKKLQILTLFSILILEASVFVKRNLRLFEVNSSIHHQDTRNKNNIHINCHNLSLFAKGPHHFCSIIYNKLPPSIKSISSPNLFKYRLKTRLLNKAYYSLNEYLEEKL